MINISHGSCDVCIQENDLNTRIKPSTMVLTINNKQLEFCNEHFKEFVDLLNIHYEKNFGDTIKVEK